MHGVRDGTVVHDRGRTEWRGSRGERPNGWASCSGRGAVAYKERKVSLALAHIRHRRPLTGHRFLSGGGKRKKIEGTVLLVLYFYEIGAPEMARADPTKERSLLVRSQNLLRQLLTGMRDLSSSVSALHRVYLARMIAPFPLKTASAATPLGDGDRGCLSSQFSFEPFSQRSSGEHDRLVRLETKRPCASRPWISLPVPAPAHERT